MSSKHEIRIRYRKKEKNNKCFLNDFFRTLNVLKKLKFKFFVNWKKRHYLYKSRRSTKKYIVRNKLRKMLKTVLQYSCPILLLFNFVNASHFRGGTISWKPTGNGNEVNPVPRTFVRISLNV